MPRDTESLDTLEIGDALHLILSCRDLRLRVCITSALERTELAFVIPANSMAALRLEAALQLTALQLGNPKAFTRPPFMPTRYDRARLDRLLAVADAAEHGASPRALPIEVVFPQPS